MAYPFTEAEFKACYPEFAAASDALVAQKVAEAASEMNETTWGGKYTRALMLSTANLMALTPEGERMRRKDGTTVYADRLRKLLRATMALKGRVG